MPGEPCHRRLICRCRGTIIRHMYLKLLAFCFAGLLFVTFCCKAEPAPDPGRYFAIEVVDAQTGRGVPMVELKTTSSAVYYTDSNGLVAFYEPGLMGSK